MGKITKHLGTRLAAAVLGAVLATPGALPVRAEAQAVPGYGGVDIFEIPELAAAEQDVLARARGGDLEGARTVLAALSTRHPEAGRLHLLEALLALGAGETDMAITALEAARRLGAPGLARILAHPRLAALGDDPRLAALAAAADPPARVPAPALVTGGTALVTAANTGWEAAAARLVPRLAFPPVLGTHRYAPGRPKGAAARLNQLVARGLAAGNTGDLYDNRDEGHSTLPAPRRTQLTHVRYGPEARARRLHYGLNTSVLFEAPTFGNSSTAVTSGAWRSQPRLALTTPGGAARLWQLYAANHVYVFPEHRDHDPVSAGGHGDLFPAATPYVLISQGSSGSDRPLLEAVQTVLAAFPPAVKARLTEDGLIAPMVQQVIRHGLAGAAGADYLDPRAHPVVIDGAALDPDLLIDRAQALTPGTIPPRVDLAVLRETPPHPSIFADGLSEVLFDTPGAVARVWRGASAVRAFEIAAEAEDPNGRDLTFHWVALRGDPDAIEITPLDEAGSRVRLRFGWQGPHPVPGRAEITAPRADIAVFADNGAELSAPAIFSMLYPGHQKRRYDGPRPVEIDTAVPTETYADPLIWPERGWRDVYDYDAGGRTRGWTRTRGDGNKARFTAHGHLVLEEDSAGRPALTEAVSYPLSARPGGGLAVIETRTDQRYRYRYQGPEDRIGVPVPLSQD